LTEALSAFAANTMRFVEQESDQFLERQKIPQIATNLEGQTVLMVVRGYHYREDLMVLRSFVREKRPVIIGVDGGADAVLEAGLKPDLIVGDMDSVSDKALRSGAELIVHAYKDGRAPGALRLDELGLEYVLLPMAGTSEDVAMIVADDKGAALIVAVGTHQTLAEFLDKGREGMASTFLTRLRVGGKLVDAKGVSRLYRQGVSNWQLVWLVAAGLVAVFAALSVTSAGQTILGLMGAFFDDSWAWIKQVWQR
ncbi:MAG: thiamine pyrophosphokinase, partial [Bifidobacteriaceae bacterium]|nr:thiamine pyrophosphokinase [Bifidobacteriaceae bacterium]